VGSIILSKSRQCMVRSSHPIPTGSGQPFVWHQVAVNRRLERVLQTAFEEHEDIDRELQMAREENREAHDKDVAWDNGFLFKRVFKKTFAKRKADADIAKTKVEELGQQLLLTTVSTHVEIAKEQAEPYFRMRDEFASLSECTVIWDIKTRQATDKFRERTTASMRVGRARVMFS
jgi:hypothetical protein